MLVNLSIEYLVMSNTEAVAPKKVAYTVPEGMVKLINEMLELVPDMSFDDFVGMEYCKVLNTLYLKNVGYSMKLDIIEYYAPICDRQALKHSFQLEMSEAMGGMPIELLEAEFSYKRECDEDKQAELDQTTPIESGDLIPF